MDGATSITGILQKDYAYHCLRPILVYTLVITSLIGGVQLFDVPQILTNGNR